MERLHMAASKYRGQKIQQALLSVVAALFDVDVSQIGAWQCYNENQAEGAPGQK